MSLGPSVLLGRHNDMVLCCSYCSGSGLKGCGNPGEVQTWGCSRGFHRYNFPELRTTMLTTAHLQCNNPMHPNDKKFQCGGNVKLFSGESVRFVAALGFQFFSVFDKIFSRTKSPQIELSIQHLCLPHFAPTPKMARIACWGGRAGW